MNAAGGGHPIHENDGRRVCPHLGAMQWIAAGHRRSRLFPWGDRRMIIPLDDGKSVSVTASGGSIRLQIDAYRGSMAVQLPRAAAIQLRTAILAELIEDEKCTGSSSEQSS